jgi:hypothetical protein
MVKPTIDIFVIECHYYSLDYLEQFLESLRRQIPDEMRQHSRLVVMNNTTQHEPAGADRFNRLLLRYEPLFSLEILPVTNAVLEQYGRKGWGAEWRLGTLSHGACIDYYLQQPRQSEFVLHVHSDVIVTKSLDALWQAFCQQPPEFGWLRSLILPSPSDPPDWRHAEMLDSSAVVWHLDKLRAFCDEANTLWTALDERGQNGLWYDTGAKLLEKMRERQMPLELRPELLAFFHIVGVTSYSLHERFSAGEEQLGMTKRLETARERLRQVVEQL